MGFDSQPSLCVFALSVLFLRSRQAVTISNMLQQVIRSGGQHVIVMNESTRNHNCRKRKKCTRPRANDDSHASHRGPDRHRATVSRQVTSISPRKSQLKEGRYLILSCANKTGDVKAIEMQYFAPQEVSDEEDGEHTVLDLDHACGNARGSM